MRRMLMAFFAAAALLLPVPALADDAVPADPPSIPAAGELPSESLPDAPVSDSPSSSETGEGQFPRVEEEPDAGGQPSTPLPAAEPSEERAPVEDALMPHGADPSAGADIPADEGVGGEMRDLGNPPDDPDPAPDRAVPDGTYVIRSQNAERQVLDVTGCSSEDGANAEIWSSNGGANQKWDVARREDGAYTLRSVLSGKYLDVSGASEEAGANVIQWRSNGGDNQRWRFVDAEGGLMIVSALSEDLCLDISGASKKDGGNVIVWSPHGGRNQLWELVSAEIEVDPGAEVPDGWYRIGASDGVVLDVAGCSSGDGANVELWTSNTGINQAFYIDFEDGYVTIETGTGGFVSTTGADPIPGSDVTQRSVPGSDSHRYALERDDDGRYLLRNVANGLYLGAGSGASGSNVYSSAAGCAFDFERIRSFIDDGSFYIAPNHASHRYVEAGAAMVGSGSSVDLGIWYGGLNQKWYLDNVDDADNTFLLIAADSGLAMSARGSSVALAAQDHADAAQLWHAKPSAGGWIFENEATSKVLDVIGQSASAGARVGVWTGNGGANQRFTLTAARLIEHGTVISIALSDATDTVVDVNGCSGADDAAITAWSFNGGGNQQWRASVQSNGTVKLRNISSGKYLSLTANGTVAQLGASSGASQDWTFSYHPENGTFTISAAAEGGAGALLVQGASNGSAIALAQEGDVPTGFRLYEQQGYGQSNACASTAQKRLAELAWNEPTTPSGWCALWVHNVFDAYGSFPDVYGNADDLYDNFCTSSDPATLRTGMIVAVSRHPGTSGGRIYGHIGIYVGDGFLLDSSGSVRLWKVEDWVASYNGWVPAKWGWYGGRKLG